MDWTAQIDGYCERVDFTFWSEPLNAITNVAFMIAAIIMYRRTAGLPMGRVLSVVLFIIGIGSALLHTFATQWASLSDVVPIVVFILAYIFVAFYAYVGLNTAWSAVAVLMFFPFAYVTIPLFQKLDWLGFSAAYMPVPILIAGMGMYLWNKNRPTAIGLLIGVAILLASLTFRTLDLHVCDSVPIGTHFMWHILNGLMLGWMIEVYRRHMLAHRTGAG